MSAAVLPLITTGRCGDCRRGDVKGLCPHFNPPGTIPAAERLRCPHFKSKEKEAK